jgi:glycerol-3-phosphate dehydrogenase (NAD(P)+)
VWGLAGVGDALVTSLGGRNRAYGLRVGKGEPPAEALAAMAAEGLTVEGYDATARMHELVERLKVDAPLLRAVHAVLFEGAPARQILEVGLGGYAGG